MSVRHNIYIITIVIVARDEPPATTVRFAAHERVTKRHVTSQILNDRYTYFLLHDLTGKSYSFGCNLETFGLNHKTKYVY